MIGAIKYLIYWNWIVENRCREIRISQKHKGISNKLKKLNEIICDLSDVAYIGDDINDLSVMSEIKENGGIVDCPQDAVNQVIQLADFNAVHNG